MGSRGLAAILLGFSSFVRWHPGCLEGGMTTCTELRTDPSPSCVLRWVLASGSAAIACEIDANADRSFDLRIVPFSAPGSGFVEHFQTATAVLERHAHIARNLRDAGWRTTDRMTARRS
jgi:hypothetical protein